MNNINYIENIRTSVKDSLVYHPLLQAALNGLDLSYSKGILNNDILELLLKRDGAWILKDKLPKFFTSNEIGTNIKKQEAWQYIGLFYLYQAKYNLALPIFHSLYHHMLESQNEISTRVHKGMPLVWVSDCYFYLGYSVLAKRYLMQTLCEDAIMDIPRLGRINTEEGGVYFRLVWRHGMSDSELDKYAKEIYEFYNKDKKFGVYPEWLLQNIDNNWMIEFPNTSEVNLFLSNPKYIKFLINNLGDGTGKKLELLAEYLLSCMAGCKTTKRKRSYSSEYDIVCTMEGFDLDFRSELGRYFVCECKDLKNPIDFTKVSKFCRVLDSIKSRFGIIFSVNGITGQGKNKFAERELLKVYQDRGIIIIVIDLKDIKDISNGKNFVNLLRERYEKVRLDLI